MTNGSMSTDWYEYRNDWTHVQGEVIQEALITLYVNGMELATIMVTPNDLECYTLGFLKNEGLIAALDEVENIHIKENNCCVDIWLSHAIIKPERAIITSECGGGITFEDPALNIQPLQEECSIHPDRLFELFQMLHYPESLYARTRGVHAAGITNGEGLLAVAEDVGRHNAIDKILGACLLKGIDTRGLMLLATGRISSEMVRKAGRMGCPLVASRNSPTSMAVTMARAWNITLIGYVRQHTLRVYAHPQRLSTFPHTD